LFFGIFAMAAAMGKYLPIRSLLFYFVPLMDVFRFPSFFQLFALLAMIVLAAKELSYVFENGWHKKTLAAITFPLIAIILMAMGYSLKYIDLTNISFFVKHDSLLTLLKASTLGEHVFIHGVIQVVIVSAFIVLLYQKKLQGKSLFSAISGLLIVEMVIATQLNMFYTGVSTDKPSGIRSYVAATPKGFPIPDLHAIAANTDQAAQHSPLWRNTNIFRKQISADGFNSFKLRANNYLYDSLPKLKDAIIKNPFVYLTDKVWSYKQLNDSLLIDSSSIFVDAQQMERLSKLTLKRQPADSLSILSFQPNEIVVKTATANNVVLTLLQSNYPGWRVKINDKPAELFISNYLTMSTVLPAGENMVKFEYNNKNLRFTFFVSNILFFILLIVIAYPLSAGNRHRKLFFLGIVAFLSLAVITLIFRNKANGKQLQQQYSGLQNASVTQNRKLLFESTNDFENRNESWIPAGCTVDSLNKYEGKYSFKLDENVEYSPTLKIEIGKLGKLEFDVSTKVFALLPEKSKAELVLEIERNGKSLEWYSATISHDAAIQTVWKSTNLKHHFSNLQPGDILKVYVWNSGKKTVFIDNLEVKVEE